MVQSLLLRDFQGKNIGCNNNEQRNDKGTPECGDYPDHTTENGDRVNVTIAHGSHGDHSTPNRSDVAVKVQLTDRSVVLDLKDP